MHVFAFNLLSNVKMLVSVFLVHDLQKRNSSSRYNSVASLFHYSDMLLACAHF